MTPALVLSEEIGPVRVLTMNRPEARNALSPKLIEIIGEHGHYRFKPGTICRLMWEDYDRTVGKQVASAA